MARPAIPAMSGINPQSNNAAKENRRMPDLKEPACVKDEYKYDFDKASRILQAMDFLRGEAVKTGIEEIVTMVDASFRLLLATYSSILRYEMSRLSGSDLMQ